MTFEEEEEDDEDEEGATTSRLSQAPWREAFGEDDLCYDTIEGEESCPQDQIDLAAELLKHPRTLYDEEVVNQKADSANSMIEPSSASTIFRSAVMCGRTCETKYFAAATLPV